MTILEEINLQEAVLRNHSNEVAISLTMQLLDAVDLLKRIAENATTNEAMPRYALVSKELIDEIQAILRN